MVVRVPKKSDPAELAKSRRELYRARQQLSQAQHHVSVAKQSLSGRDAALQDLLRRLGQKEREIDALYRSTSWRITRPLREMLKSVRGLSKRQTRAKIPALTIAPQAAAVIPEPRFGKLPRRTIFIECTHTYHSDLNTGIQRVVRNIIRFSPQIGAEFGFDVVPVIAENGRMERADVQQVLANKQSVVVPVPPLSSRSLPVRPLQPTLRRRLRAVAGATRRTLATVLPFGFVHRFLYAPPHAIGPRWLLSLPRRALKTLKGRKPAPQSVAPNGAAETFRHLDQIDDQSGNVLLLLDSSWTTPIWPPSHRFKTAGGKIIGIVYDLIPITHAHTSVPELTTLFKQWVAVHMETSDGFIAISKSVADQIRDFAVEQRETKWSGLTAPIGHFHLGSKLDFSSAEATVSPRIEHIFADTKPTYLMVGSIEPRKMHQHVVDTFDRLWSEGMDIRLVIVGRQAWKTDELIQRMKDHPRLGSELFVLRDASDGELEACYEKSSALIIASEIEGFGLPVVEALQRGLPVLCSDIPVFREVAADNALYFKLNDIDDLAALLRRISSANIDDQLPRRVVEWMDWEQSTRQLFTTLDRLVGEHEPAHCLKRNDVIEQA